MPTLCINRSHSRFTHLQRQTGLPAEFLSAKIAAWVEDNDSEMIPTAQDLGLEVKYDSEIYPFNEEQEEINYVRTSEEGNNDEEPFYFTELEAPEVESKAIENLDTPEVRAGVKAVEALQSSKAVQLFKTLKKNNVTGDTFWKKIQSDLQIPKEQIALLKAYDTTDREQLVTNMLADYSYAIEINTAVKPTVMVGEMTEFYLNGTNYEVVDGLKGAVYYKSNANEGIFEEKISKEEFENAVKKASILKGDPTQYYSNLTVPGGTNYTENEIATPAITPSIRGHAQFATDKGIGWFRSDDQVEGGKYYPGGVFEGEMIGATTEGGTSTKTRRILEVQSDLFQKGRANDILTPSSEIPYNNKQVENIIDRYTSGESITEEENKIASEYINKKSTTNPKNQFLQLLNKDNNWVTFFVKSIIQDSAKKGYEKVLFPTGSTVYKIESGGNTIEDFIKNKENRLKELTDSEVSVIKKEDKSDPYDKPFKIIRNNQVESSYITRDAAEKEAYNLNINIGTEKKRVEKEIEDAKAGVSGLAATAKFYQETVANVLKKQGYNPRLITDEYGNTWNEISIESERDSQKILFQLTSEQEEPSDAEIDRKVTKFLEKIGVDVRSVNKIHDMNGKPLSAVAKADMLNKIIEVVNERAAIDTLPEEAAHFFVEMLGPGNDLYKKMYNSITGYKIYSQVVDQYKNLKEYRTEDGAINFDKLKKEAIGKVIAEHMIKGNKYEESEAKLNAFAKFWKDVWDFIRFYFSDIEVEDNPFMTAAEKIAAADTSDLDTDTPGDGIYYSYADPVEGLMRAQKDITLDNSVDPATGQKRHVYYFNGEPGKGSVTSYYVDPWLRKIFRSDDRSEAQKLVDITKADYGDDIHEQIQEIIKSWTNADGTKRDEQKPVSPIVNGSIYKTLNLYIQQVMAQYDEGTRFLAEVKIFDPKKKIGGSIDLLVIQPTGEVDIYDWKSQEIYRGQDDIKQYKETMYRIQLDEYRKILQKEYGFEKFGRIRAIPIKTQFLYRDGEIQNLRNIEIGPLDLDKIPEEKSYLLPVALKTESTGDKELDTLIEKLNAVYEKLEKTRPSKEEVYKKKEELGQLRLAIRDLQLRGRIDKMVNLGLVEYKKYSERLKNNELSGRDLQEGIKILEVFSSSGILLYNLREQELEVLKESGDVKAIQAFERMNKKYLAMTANVAKLIEDMKDYRDGQVEQMAGERGLTNALDPEAPLAILPAAFQSLSNIDRKLFRLFSKNLRLAQNTREVKFDQSVAKLKELKNNFSKWASDKGMSINQALESLLNIDEKGNWNGNFLAKYQKEFYKRRDEAIATGNAKWFLENTSWDPEKKYEAEEKRQLEVFKGVVFDADEKQNERIIKEKMKDWIENHKVIGPNKTLNMKALMNKKNQFLKPKDSWLTEKYQELYRKDATGNYVNKPAIDAYEYFQSLIRYSEGLGMLDKYSPGFIPSMFANNLENFSFGKTSNVFNKNFLEKLQVDSGTQYTPEIDPTDGTIINRVPVYFTKDMGVKKEDGTWDYSKKSRDLFKIFGVWAGHMYNYEAMSDMEDTALMILEAEKNKGSLVTDSMGNIVIDNGRVKAIDQNDKNAKLLEEFINYYLYDRQSGVVADKSFTNPFSRKNKDEKAQYSVGKTIQSSINYFGVKTLGLNLISASAQFVGGTGNALFQAFKGQQFTTKTWMQAVYLANGSSKAKKALKYFNITEGTGKEGVINDLSLSSGSQYINRNNAYILQRWADKRVTQPIAVSMMLEHMIDDQGNIVNIQKYVKNKYNYNENFYNLPSDQRAEIKQKIDEEVGKLKEEKSLLAIGVVDEKTGEFSLPGISQTDETYAAFKDKINGMIKKVIGNTGRDDINNLRTGMFGSALSQFRSWIPEMVEERMGGLKYDDELDQWTYGKFNTFFGELFSYRFGRLAKALITGLGDDAIQMAKEKYLELKTEALEANKEFNISEAEFIDMYIANLRSTLGELVLLLGIGAAVLSVTSGDDDKEKSGIKKYLARALRKYWNEFSFYYNPMEFQRLLKSPVPAVGLLEDFAKFSISVVKQGAGAVMSDEEMMKEAKPAKYLLRSVPVGKEFLLIAAALDDDFRKEWDIKLTNYF